MKLNRRSMQINVVSVFLLAFVFAGFSARAGEKTKKLRVEEGMKAVNGTELYYKTVGEGTPIVILHGGPGLDHSYFLPQMAELARHYKLIFFDQRASGKSSNVVHCPTMIIGSTYDMVAPEANEKLHQSIPGSTLVVLDSCGHFPFVEAPRRFFGLLEGFLKKAAR